LARKYFYKHSGSISKAREGFFGPAMQM